MLRLVPRTTLVRAIELYLETPTEDERSAALSREILPAAVEVHAYCRA